MSCVEVDTQPLFKLDSWFGHGMVGGADREVGAMGASKLARRGIQGTSVWGGDGAGDFFDLLAEFLNHSELVAVKFFVELGLGDEGAVGSGHHWGRELTILETHLVKFQYGHLCKIM